ncbi:MAG: hypothetical protein F9K13_07465 [Candidatus Methylomirabilis oxygeniifera]|uniref:Putative WD40 domain protein beta Propeller n=1 Tax=Methylomirabilis oxygeniifera TaxID=671143 RepID=D5ML88_METO1|nr:MAG: hypothetical protein F9K13_07465 [Candidatus Methylomirabilis oxyfera]CBE69930.1 putative WD40 domain protein beta Propeller precursor [Candidatus Methylomirabilis oxyfera]
MRSVTELRRCTFSDREAGAWWRYVTLAVMMLITWWNPGISEAQYTYSQLTTTTGDGSASPSISADGTRIAFRSNRNLTGGNSDGNYEIFLWISGSGFTQITDTTGDSTYSYLSISADGTRIAFRSNRNLTGGNSDGNYEIFLWISGSGFTQITDTTGGENFTPFISADGTRIAFGSNRNLVTGGNLDGNPEIFLWTAGSGFTQVTATNGASTHYNPSINADGTRIAFYSTHDLTGSNLDHNSEIFLWTFGSGVIQITNTTEGGSDTPSISADGTRIAFVSTGNPVPGGNLDGNYEIFLWTASSGFTQVTATTEGYNWQPFISADGTRIAFGSNRNLTGSNPDGNWETFLWTAFFGFAQLTTTTAGVSSGQSLNTDGTKIAFVSTSNLTGGNPDGNPEIILASSPSVELAAVGSGPGPMLTNPVSVSYTLQGCNNKEIFLVVNAPAMGIPWSYLGASGWVSLPADLSTVTPYLGSGQADGTYSLYAGTAPAGTYELYLGCDYVMDGHLNIDTSAGLNLNGVYDYLSVTVQ